MINTNILKILESNFQEPSYSIIVSKFEQPEYCNKDKLKIYLQQFNPNLEKIIESQQNIIDKLKLLLIENNIDIPNLQEPQINSCIQKTLSIESSLDYNKTDGLYISKLNGTLDNDTDVELTNRYLSGEIKNRQVKTLVNDVPNYFNRSKFKIKDNKLIVSIPKKVESFVFKLTETTSENIITYTENNIEDNRLSINIDTEKTYTFTLSYSLYEELTTQSIESIVTPLSNKIEIEFENIYYEIPGVILTIDKDKKVYTTYNTTFIMDENNYYSGVIVELNGLKKQKQYPDINITIIGKTGV